MEAQVAELEHQLLDGLGLGLGQRRPLRGQPLAEGHEDGIKGRLGSASAALDGDGDGFFLERPRQRAELGAVQGEGDHGEGIAAPLGLHAEGVLELLDHPIGLQGRGAHQHRQPTGGLDRRRDLTPQGIATLELARIDPQLHPQIRQRRPQLQHDVVVLAAMGEEQVGQRGGAVMAQSE